MAKALSTLERLSVGILRSLVLTVTARVSSVPRTELIGVSRVDVTIWQACGLSVWGRALFAIVGGRSCFVGLVRGWGLTLRQANGRATEQND